MRFIIKGSRAKRKAIRASQVTRLNAVIARLQTLSRGDIAVRMALGCIATTLTADQRFYYDSVATSQRDAMRRMAAANARTGGV